MIGATRAALTATTASVLAVSATVVAVTSGPATALPNTSLTGFLEVPPGASGFVADTSPSGALTAVAWGVDGPTNREVWLTTRGSGVWSTPVLVSDPNADAWDPSIDVDATGTVGVSFVEDSSGSTADVMVVRRVGQGGPGPRQEVAVDPYDAPMIAIDGQQTLIAWSRYDGNLRTYAAIDAGNGFGAPVQVSADSWNGDTYPTAVTARSGLHVAMVHTWWGPTQRLYEATWAIRTASAWNSYKIPSGYTGTSTPVHDIETDPATGDALIVHTHWGNDNASHAMVTVFDSNPLAIGPPNERLRAPIDLGPTNNMSPWGAMSRAGQLTALLATHKVDVSVPDDTDVVVDSNPPLVDCGTRWVLTASADYVCYSASYGTQIDLTTGDGNVIGSLAPSAGATEVSATWIEPASPVLVVEEYRSGPNPQWLLDVGAGDGVPPSTPPTNPTVPGPTAPGPSAPGPTGPAPSPAPVTFTNIKPAKIKGTAVVGKTLKATPGVWNPTPSKVRYQWLANGKAIKRATKAKLRLTRALVGKKVSVRITLTTTGVTTRTMTIKAKKRVARG